MEAEVLYRAKDGRVFNDAMECEKYERTIGIVPGSIGHLVSMLEDIPGDYCINLTVLFYDHSKQRPSMHIFHSTNNSDPDDALSFEKNHIFFVKEAVCRLKELPQDFQCEYLGYTCKSLDGNIDSRMLANSNPIVIDNINKLNH